MDASTDDTNQTPIPPARFRLGRTVATPGALAALDRSGQSAAEFVSRHQRGDWGDVPVGDAVLNDEAVAHEGDADQQQRVLSAYTTRRGDRLWVVTEWDRSDTTLLLPSEY